MCVVDLPEQTVAGLFTGLLSASICHCTFNPNWQGEILYQDGQPTSLSIGYVSKKNNLERNKKIRPRGYKTFYMLIAAEHENSKCS